MEIPPPLCPGCGLPFAVNQAAEPIPCCPISSEFEWYQKEIWAEFNNARLLQTLDFFRLVSTDQGYLSLMEFLQYYDHPDLVWESVPRATDKFLMQVVYVNGRGCKLLKWPFG